jgi:hypothetical protein
MAGFLPATTRTRALFRVASDLECSINVFCVCWQSSILYVYAIVKTPKDM